MTVRAHNGEILAISLAGNVMQLESGCIRLSTNNAHWILRTQAAQ